jgi:hypothetical protein
MARLAGGTRDAMGANPGRKPRRAISPAKAIGLAESTMVSTTRLCEPAIAFSKAGVRQA